MSNGKLPHAGINEEADSYVAPIMYWKASGGDFATLTLGPMAMPWDGFGCHDGEGVTRI